jgi:signal transduction histidine kinase
MRGRAEYVQHVSRDWSFVRRYAFDALVVAVAVEGALEVSLRQSASDAPETSVWLAAPAIALVALPLLARRRFPFAAPAGVWLLAAAFSFLDGRLIVFTASASIAGLAAAFLLGNLRDGMKARLGLAITVGGAALVMVNNPEHSAADLVFTPILFGIGWLAGFALRERAEQAEAAEARAAQAEREREAAARIAVAEERARIARELHDIVAHAVSVMVLQVGAIRHNLPDTVADDKDALQGVERTGRSALTEMRRLLGAMRDEGQDAELTPQPGLDSLDSLLEEVGRAGLPVRLHREGEPSPLPRAIELSAYRIIQEGLTNALKHAQASRADVTVRYAPNELQLEIRDDGRGVSDADGLGHGLVGVRERVKIYGGEMSSGPANGGGFVLRTRLPLGEHGR